MAHYFTIIGRHLECAIQPELVVKIEFVLIERKQPCRFRHNSVICQKDMKEFSYVDEREREREREREKKKKHRAKNKGEGGVKRIMI